MKMQMKMMLEANHHCDSLERQESSSNDVKLKGWMSLSAIG